MHVILYHPQIPPNTGNIIRTCMASNTSLSLVPPLGFSLSNKYLKRAGLDYCDSMQINIIENLYLFLQNTQNDFYFFSSKAKNLYTKKNYTKKSILIFGSELEGLPPIFFNTWDSKFVTIPMFNKTRCLNLSNCVSIAIYEALRQQSFSVNTSHDENFI